jgi:hypothetical protein
VRFVGSTMRTSRIGLALAVVLAGCTSIFGLTGANLADRDDDGVIDGLDNCEAADNPDQSDWDRNGIGDACDVCVDGGVDDLDADGILDLCDGCIGIGVDADHDRIDDGCDACQNMNRDVDGDGIDDGCDICIGNTGVDEDLDGIDDACDSCIGKSGIDVDGDGFDDACDQCIAMGRDDDGDLIDDNCDPCVSMDNKDADGDKIQDACDACVSTNVADADGDQIQDGCDPCVCNPKPGCTTSIPHDEDKDMVDDGCDNCVIVPNPNQDASGDTDGVGAACDPHAGTNESERVDTFADARTQWYLEGAWTIANDMTFVDALTPSTTARRFLVFPLQLGSFRVESRLEMKQLDMTSSVALDLYDNYLTGTSVVSCEATFLLVSATSQVRVTLREGTTVLGMSGAIALSSASRLSLMIQFDASTNNISCEVASGGNSIATKSTLSPATPLYAGLIVRKATAWALSFSAIGVF